jgi:glycosyltransferase involved in cell wall biosynthesis
MTLPKISVIIPFYNEEDVLEKAVLSALNQSYSNIEIILINDGSTDNSKKIAEKICKKQYNCNLISIKNSGPGIARNIGINRATGKYICFLDADDLLSYNSLEILLNNIKNNNSDLSIGMYQMLNKNKEVIKKKIYQGNKLVTSNQVIKALITKKITPVSWAKLYKTNIAKNCEFPNLFWKEDDVFLLKYLLLSKNVSIINKVVVLNNCRNNSLTRQTISDKMISEIVKSFQIQDRLIPKKYEKELVQSKIESLLNLFLILKIDSDKLAEKNRKSILKSLFKFADKISENSNIHKITFKKKVLLFCLKRENNLLLNLIYLLKQKQINKLKLIKA